MTSILSVKNIQNIFLHIVLDDEFDRLKKELNIIQDKHEMVYKSRAFILDGKPIWNGDVSAAKTLHKKQLDLEYQDKARYIVAKQERMKIDRQRLNNFFSVISRKCTTEQDYRDIFPDIVANRLSDYFQWHLPRVREPGYAFHSSPVKEKLFQNGMDIVYYYLANELVF